MDVFKKAWVKNLFKPSSLRAARLNLLTFVVIKHEKVDKISKTKCDFRLYTRDIV